MTGRHWTRRWRHRVKPWEITSPEPPLRSAPADVADSAPPVQVAPRSRRRYIWRAGIPLAVLVALAVVPVVPVSVARAGADSPPAPACPGGVSTCQTVTLPCPPGQQLCPTVTAGPTTGIGAGQYVYVEVSNFTAVPQDQIALSFCAVSSAHPGVVADPQCADGQPSLFSSLEKTELPVDSDGSLVASFPTAFVPSGQGNNPLEATDFQGNSPTRSHFFCDNGPDFCALEVTDSAQSVENGPFFPPEDATNTAIFPITFANASAGCPAADPTVFTDSAFSVQQFIPAAVDSTCGSASGVADVNTATDTQTIVSDFAHGGSPISFTDEPGAAFEQTALKGISYTYVPIAVSATVVGFLAGDFNSSAAFPQTTFNLTPKMAAGLITSAYGQPLGSDGVLADQPPPFNTPTGCAPIQECTGGVKGGTPVPSRINTFALLNPAPAGTQGPQAFGMFFSSVASGSSYQVTNWLCSQPNVAFPLTFHTFPPKKKKSADNAAEPAKKTPTTTLPPSQTPNILDPAPQNANPGTDQGRNASQTLTSPPANGIAWPPQNDPNAGSAQWPFQSCSAYPALPILAGAGNNQYSFAGTPANQAVAIRKYAYNGSKPLLQGTSRAGFGAMDWSQASYFGLDVASVLNAAGKFVPPTRAGVDAALDEATVQPNGLVTPNYGGTDASAYPMPMITYALVSTAPQLRAKAEAEKSLLTNLVNYSHSGGSIPLPSGYVPLPDNLYSAALTNIAKINPNGVAPSSPPGGTGGVVTPQSASGVDGSGGVVGTLGAGARFVIPRSGSGGSAAQGSGGHSHRPRYLGPSFEPVLFAVLSGVGRLILPLLIVLALVGLLLGPSLVAWMRVRRSRSARATP